MCIDYLGIINISSAGIVTTTRITHGTPAALYATTAAKIVESDKDAAPFKDWGATLCKDIASQFVEGKRGKYLKVRLRLSLNDCKYNDNTYNYCLK